MLSLSDICEEEEEEDDDDANENEREKEKRDGRLCLPISDGGKRGSDEMTRLLIGHPDKSYYPGGNTCDDIGSTLALTPLHSGTGSHKDGSDNSSSITSKTNNSSNGGDREGSCQRHALGELHPNGTAEPRRTRVNVTDHLNNGKLDGFALIDEKALNNSGIPQVNDKRKSKDRRKRDHHRHHHHYHHRSNKPIDKDVRRNNHLPRSMEQRAANTSSSPSSSSSLSPSSPCPPSAEFGATTPDSGSNTNSNRAEPDELVERDAASTAILSNRSRLGEDCESRAVGVEISKTTSICFLMDRDVRVACPQPQTQQQQQRQRQLHQQREQLDHGVDTTATKVKVPVSFPAVSDAGLASVNNNKCHSTSVDASSSNATTPSDDFSLSQSSSSSFSANQHAKRDDVGLPNHPHHSHHHYHHHHHKSYRTLIPIHEVKRSLTRKQVVQLAAMTGIGFVFVAFIILWLMSPVFL